MSPISGVTSVVLRNLDTIVCHCLLRSHQRFIFTGGEIIRVIGNQTNMNSNILFFRQKISQNVLKINTIYTRNK